MNKTSINDRIKEILENNILEPIDNQTRRCCSSKIYFNPWDENRNRFRIIRQTGTTINICVEKIYHYIK